MTPSRGALLLVAALLSNSALAHPLAPALLEVREVAPDAFEVLWRTSTLRVQLQDVAPRLPSNCAGTEASPEVEVAGNAMSMRWAVRCAGGLTGRVIQFDGLERSAINVILRIQALDGAANEVLLDARRPHYTVTPPPATASSVWRYFVLGMQHLLSGLDHLLFVGGLLMLVAGWRRLVLTLTAFTLGHSVTLALATLGYLRISPALAELGIALSILVLACELAKNGVRHPLFRSPWVMAAGFGLLHGLGFAGALAEVGLPAGEIVAALLGFNLGIEAAQLGVVAIVAFIAAALKNRDVPYLWRRVLPVYFIGTLSAWWCIERAAVVMS